MDMRRHPRMAVDGLTVDLSDGKGFFVGTVSDLSRLGLMVENVPQRLDEKTPEYLVILSGRGMNFKMRTKSRWFAHPPLSKKIGMEILHAPWGWTEFVMRFEPEKDNIWDEMSL